MSKVAVVYWSSTGNTEMMAKAIIEGAEGVGSIATLLKASNFEVSMVSEYDTIAFGCSSMGAEQLDDTEFEPMFESVKDSLKDKKVALFGSYGWGDGEWMRTWEEDTRNNGANIVVKSLIINETPDADGLNRSREFGKNIAKA
jgi:flavodoxin I